MKTKYAATFADGTTVTRSSEREYLAAYRVTVDGGKTVIAKGFSGSVDMARKAAAREASNTRYGSTINGKFVAFCKRGPVAEVVPTTAQ